MEMSPGVTLLVIIACFFLAYLCYVGMRKIDENGKEKYGEETWKQIKESQKQAEEAKKYHNYIFTCPVCNSHRVRKISDADRAISVATLGVASSKIGKQYECDNCDHKW